MESMVKKTSEDFEFVVRSNNQMTHKIWEDKKRTAIRDTSEVFKQFRERIQPMREACRLGCVLIQCPTFFFPKKENFDYIKRCRERLDAIPLVIEFRNKGWVKESTFPFCETMVFDFVWWMSPSFHGSCLLSQSTQTR